LATRHEVAVLAGTSDSVVSYVLNGGPRGVAPATKDRVLRAIAELNYRPNALARSLKFRQSMTLGLVLPDSSNPFFAQLAQKLENEAFEYGYTLLFGNAMDDDDREAVYVRALIDRQADGLLLIPSHGARAWEADLVRSGIPSVVLDRDISLEGTSTFITDNVAGGAAATRHLLGHGHSNVVCLAGPRDEQPTTDRVLGWRQALEGAGVGPGEQRVVYASFGRAASYAAARGLFGEPERPSAIFVTSDEQATGVIRAAYEAGMRVPEDIAICSFDGIEGSAYMVPSLTTMAQPIESIARAALGHLLERIAEPLTPSTHETFSATLIPRRSCGCAEVSAAQDESLTAVQS